MYRILDRSGRSRDSRYVQHGLAVAYVLFAAAGVLLLASGDALGAYGTPGRHMAGFMAAGGALCAGGCITRHWVGEFVGAPLLVVALTVLAVETVAVGWAGNPLLASANGGLLLGVSAILSARWRVVLAVVRVAHAIALRGGGRS